jgi:CheY-like chemotaxis protein
LIKILIVDDNRIDQLLATRLLTGPYEFIYASDGNEAVNLFESECPDLVVTDIKMPNMDGLQLLTELKTLQPDTPVIVMTSNGDEATAASAIKLGAASFVPKQNLSTRLSETVDQVVDLMRADRDYHRLLERLRKCHYFYELENDFSLIDPLVEFIQQIAFSEGLCDRGIRNRIGVALVEALFNAMYHGNLQLPQEHTHVVRAQLRKGDSVALVEERRKDPKYENRTVQVFITGTPAEMTIAIEDKGEGFDHKRLETQNGLEVDSNKHRGILLIKSIMDQVTYNEVGNRITLVKARSQ